MARKRFNAAEKELLKPGALIQWQNVTQWHDGVVITGEIETRDGWQSVEVRNVSTRGHLRAQDVVPATPGHVRARP